MFEYNNSNAANLSSVSSRFSDLAALFEVSQIGDSEIVLDILRNNIDSANFINGANHLDFETPLHVSSEWGRLEVVKVLLGFGAKVDPKNSLGRTPLHLASEQGHIEIAELLIRYGANVCARDEGGNTPLHCAVIHPKLTLLLINKGACVNDINSNKSTPLHLAASRGSISTMTKLMNHKAHIEAADREGNTSLHIAVMSRQPNAVVLLLHAGASLDTIDCDKNSALEKARKAFGRALLDHFKIASMTKITDEWDNFQQEMRAINESSLIEEFPKTRERTNTAPNIRILHRESSSSSLISFGDDLETRSDELPVSFFGRRMSMSGTSISPLQFKASPINFSPNMTSPRGSRAGLSPNSILDHNKYNSLPNTQKSGSAGLDLMKRLKMNGFRKFFKKNPDSLINENPESPLSSSGEGSPVSSGKGSPRKKTSSPLNSPREGET